jgi:hypothetical protein
MPFGLSKSAVLSHAVMHDRFVEDDVATFLNNVPDLNQASGGLPGAPGCALLQSKSINLLSGAASGALREPSGGLLGGLPRDFRRPWGRLSTRRAEAWREGGSEPGAASHGHGRDPTLVATRPWLPCTLRLA